MHNQSTATTICNVKSLDGHSLNLRLADGQIAPTKAPEAGDHVIDAAGADLLRFLTATCTCLNLD